HDVRISGRADDLLDLGDLLQLAHRLLRVVRANEEVRVAGVTIGLLLGPVLECRIAPERPDVVHQLDLGRECAQLVRVTEAARNGDVMAPKDGLGLRHVRLGAEGSHPATSARSEESWLPDRTQAEIRIEVGLRAARTLWPTTDSGIHAQVRDGCGSRAG